MQKIPCINSCLEIIRQDEKTIRLRRPQVEMKEKPMFEKRVLEYGKEPIKIFTEHFTCDVFILKPLTGFEV